MVAVRREQLGAQEPKEIHPVRRDSVLPPLGDGSSRDAAEFCDLGRAAQGVYELSMVHASILAA